MKASSQKQLNIRSEKAYEAAQRLSKRLGVSATRVVEDALLEYEARKIVPSTRVTAEEAGAFRETLLRTAREGRDARKDRRPLDDRDLYGEDGLPI
jgi:hypothetical protein